MMNKMLSLLAGVAMLGAAGAANAGDFTLSDVQMDEVTAGLWNRADASAVANALAVGLLSDTYTAAGTYAVTTPISSESGSVSFSSADSGLAAIF